MFYILLSVVFIVIAIYNYRRRNLYIFSSKIEGPSSYPIIGMLHHLFSLKDTEIIPYVFNVVKNYKSPVKFWMGPKLVVICTEPDEIQEVLNSPNCLDKDLSYEVLNHLGNGKANMSSLITSVASDWKPNRKLLNSCFNSKVIKSFSSIYNQESNRLVQILESCVGGDSFDVARYAAACSLDMICKSSLGTDMNIQNEQNYKFIDAFEFVFDIINERIMRVYLRPDIIFKYVSNYYQEFVRNRKILQNFETEIIRKKKEQLKNRTATIESEKYNIVIHQLIKAESEGKITYDQLFGEVATTIIAGNDTTANTAAYIILMLAMHPTIQDRVYSEIFEVFPGTNFEVNLDDLQKLPYMDMVFKETLRVFPIAPIISRYVSDDIKIKHLTVPKGVTVLISIYNLHHDKRIWGPTADLFNPDNFLPENICNRHICSFIPFSFGPRSCIGMKQGTLAIKTILVHLLKSYKFTTKLKMENLEMKHNITLRLLNRHMVSIVKR